MKRVININQLKPNDIIVKVTYKGAVFRRFVAQTEDGFSVFLDSTDKPIQFFDEKLKREEWYLYNSVEDIDKVRELEIKALEQRIDELKNR